MDVASLKSTAVAALGNASVWNYVAGLCSFGLYIAKSSDSKAATAKLAEITKACDELGKKVISLSDAIDGEVSCDVAKWVWEHNESNAGFSRNMFFLLFTASFGIGYYSLFKQYPIPKMVDGIRSAVH